MKLLSYYCDSTTEGDCCNIKGENYQYKNQQIILSH